MHSIDNLNAFSKLNIELPLNTSKVPATLEVIKARKEHYLAERAKVCHPANNAGSPLRSM